MQLRDDIPRIFYPGHWGCFGGAVGPGEDGPTALRRELAEELEMQVAGCRANSSGSISISRRSGRSNATEPTTKSRSREAEVSRFVLHEGADMRLFAPDELFDTALDAL